MPDAIKVHDVELIQDTGSTHTVGRWDRTYTLKIMDAPRGPPAAVLTLTESLARKLFDELMKQDLKPRELSDLQKL